jgi:hypothetical protein
LVIRKAALLDATKDQMQVAGILVFLYGVEAYNSQFYSAWLKLLLR